MKFRTSRIQPFGLLVEPYSDQEELQDIEVEQLRSLFWQEQLLVLRGFKSLANAEEFVNYAEQWGEISVWPFGKVLELVEQDNPQDHIFDNHYIPMHWDGMYRPQVPEYQMFHCVKAPLPEQGGSTTFSNTLLALKNATSSERALWEKVTGRYKRKMEFYDSTTVSPVVTKHPYKEFSVIRYNEPPRDDKKPFLNPPGLEFTGLSERELEDFHQSLQQALYAPANFYAHSWQAGDIVIADNFCLLHGRQAYVSHAPRHLRRIHVLSTPAFNNPGLLSYR